MVVEVFKNIPVGTSMNKFFTKRVTKSLTGGLLRGIGSGFLETA